MVKLLCKSVCSKCVFIVVVQQLLLFYSEKLPRREAHRDFLTRLVSM